MYLADKKSLTPESLLSDFAKKSQYMQLLIESIDIGREHSSIPILEDISQGEQLYLLYKEDRTVNYNDFYDRISDQLSINATVLADMNRVSAFFSTLYEWIQTYSDSPLSMNTLVQRVHYALEAEGIKDISFHKKIKKCVESVHSLKITRNANSN